MRLPQLYYFQQHQNMIRIHKRKKVISYENWTSFHTCLLIETISVRSTCVSTHVLKKVETFCKCDYNFYVVYNGLRPQ